MGRTRRRGGPRAGAAPLVLALALAAGALRAEERTPCVPRIGEKLGVPFVEVCATHTSAFADASAHTPAALPAFWIAATPLPCSAGAHETVACEPVTALEASPRAHPGRNESLGALMISAEVAHRTCALRFGGRLPTPLEQEQARRVLGLASLRVREEGNRLHVDDLPEWVAEGDCIASPSKPGPGCRIRMSPPISWQPRSEADVLLVCAAEPAAAGTATVRTGATCDQVADDDGTRRPDCAVQVADSDARFALRCHTPERKRAQHPAPDAAAFRCVLAEQALGRVIEAP
jgi:hypothetical protein